MQYIEPFDGNETAIGLDIYANPARHQALDQARDTGQAVATRAITLVQETGEQQGVLVAVPHYSGVDAPSSMEQRRAQLLGFIVGVFRMDDVFSAALSGLGIRNIDARLYDETLVDDVTLLASHVFDEAGVGTRAAPGQDQSPSQGLSWSREYLMAARQWRAIVAPTPAYFSGRRPWYSWVVLAGGLSLTGMLGLFLIALTGRQLQTTRQASELASFNEALQNEVTKRKQMQRALYQEKERIEVTLHSIGDAVITTDAKGMIEFINPAAEELTEWSNAEAVGRPVTSVFTIFNEATGDTPKDPVARCLEEGKIMGLANHTVLVSRSGREFAIQDSAAPILDRNNQMIGVVLVFNDVSETRRMAREAEHYASHDALTGLVNRREFDRRLEQSLASSKQYGAMHALCYLDLDQFKIVNDTAGHGAGDELLKKLASLLAGQMRDRDTVARLGGDEFGVLLNNCPLEEALEIAESVVAAIRNFKFVWAERSFELGVSVGVVRIGGGTQTAEELLSQADVACYAAKDGGRNRVHLYASEEIDGADPRHREIIRAADIKGAVAGDRLMLHGQPIFALGGCKIERPWGYELLVRMHDDDGHISNPAAFIPAAERYGLMYAIDRWVIETALRDLDSLFPRDPDALICINLSGSSLNEEGSLAFVRDRIDRYGISPERICFEITETAAIRNLSAARGFIGDVQALGGRFALDDFGSGLSSFAYLKGLGVDFLKLDGSFVRDVARDPNDRSMVEAISSVAHTLKN